MTWTRPLVFPVLLLALIVGFTSVSDPAFGQNGKKWRRLLNQEVSDNDPRLTSLRGDLEAVFRHWDTDRDNKTSAVELAVGFRGKGAVPYRPASASEKPSPGERELKLPELVKKYPDYNFMLHWDKDRDDIITSKEFTAFVDETARHYKVLFQKMDTMERLQKILAVKNIDASRKAAIRAQMKVLNTQLANARSGFQHQLSLDYIAKTRAIRRTDWLWYRSTSASMPRR